MNMFWTVIFALLCYDIIKFVGLNVAEGIYAGWKESKNPPVVKVKNGKSKFARRLEEAVEASKKKDGIQKK